METKARDRARAALPALLLACAACASPEAAPDSAEGRATREDAAGSGRMVPASELPAEYRAAARSWKEGGEEWRAYRERALHDAALGDFLVANLVDVMVDTYTTSQLAATGQAAGPFERAQRDLVYLKERSKPVLVELLDVGDGVVAFLAGDTLVLMDDASVPVLVAEKLASPERETRRRAAELLGRLPHAHDAEPGVMLELERVLREDPEWSVRAQAALAVGQRGLLARDASVPLRSLTLALADADPAVVEAAATGIGELGDPRGVPALVNALERAARESERAKTITVVQRSLRTLTGAAEPVTPDEWRKWIRDAAAARRSP